MSTEEQRRIARDALVVLREGSACGHCRQDYDTMVQALDKDGEFEALMREYVEIERRHPEAPHLRERADQIGAARDEVARRLGRLPPHADHVAPHAPAPRANVPALPANTPGVPERGLGFRPRAARDAVRYWREEITSAFPRPFDLLRARPRRRQ